MMVVMSHIIFYGIMADVSLFWVSAIINHLILCSILIDFDSFCYGSYRQLYFMRCFNLFQFCLNCGYCMPHYFVS